LQQTSLVFSSDVYPAKTGRLPAVLSIKQEICFYSVVAGNEKLKLETLVPSVGANI